MKLSSATVNSVFVDNNTKFNGEPIEWVVAAHNVDGDGVTTLMMKTPITNYCLDAKEPQNPNTEIQKYGYGDYEKSNILQWLNSRNASGEWYQPQHEYDYPPESDTVGGTYVSENGFLYGFGDSLYNSLKTIEKIDISRKVHFPSYIEIIGSATYNELDAAVDYDAGATYPNFDGASLYKNLVTASVANSANAIRIRYTHSEKTNFDYQTGVLSYSTATSGNYSNKWVLNCKKASDYKETISSTNKGYHYTLPVIYVSSSMPVTYDSTNKKYYLEYGMSVRYSDYGEHKGGFDFEINITSADTGATTVSAFVDGSDAVIKTFSVLTYNQYTTLTFTDSDLSSLTEATNTIRLVANKDGAIAETSFAYKKIASSVPSILSNEIGNVANSFDTTYQVYDDDGDSIDVVIKIDATQIDSITDVEQKVDLTISVNSAIFNNLSYGDHTLYIVATDADGNVVTKDIPFKKCSIPTVSLSVHSMGEVLQPTSVNVNYDSADGGAVTVKAYIDGKEIET